MASMAQRVLDSPRAEYEMISFPPQFWRNLDFRYISYGSTGIADKYEPLDCQAVYFTRLRLDYSIGTRLPTGHYPMI